MLSFKLIYFMYNQGSHYGLGFTWGINVMTGHNRGAKQHQAQRLAESGFVQVPAFENEGLSFSEELQRLFRTIKRQKYLMLGVFIGVFLAALLLQELLEVSANRNLIISSLLGLCVGIIAGFIREGQDTTINSREALARTLPLPLLGCAPAIANNTVSYALQSQRFPEGKVAVAFRALRNNLLLVTRPQHPLVLNFTSSDASEGKSSSSINLASVFAASGYKVLLIDGDLRRPTLHNHFNTDNIKGFGTYLAGLCSLEAVIKPTDIANLHIITSGPTTPHAVELLGSEHLTTLVKRTAANELGFDLVIIDAPPVLALADALLISNRTHATLMVVASHQTRRSQVTAAYARLQQAKVNLIGAVLTKAR